MKKIFEISPVLFFVFVIMFVANNSQAYVKVGAGVIVSQIETFSYVYGNGETFSTKANYSDYSLHIEGGYEFPDSSFIIGWHYGKGFGEYHDPSKFEGFVDYDFFEEKDYSFIIGAGYKFYCDQTIDLPSGDIMEAEGDNLVSARIGMYKSFSNYQIGLWHHSQWARGAPFNDKWEYHKTEVTISYVF